MPDYINEPDGIEELMPWSEMIRSTCGMPERGTERLTSNKQEWNAPIPLLWELNNWYISTSCLLSAYDYSCQKIDDMLKRRRAIPEKGQRSMRSLYLQCIVAVKFIVKHSEVYSEVEWSFPLLLHCFLLYWMHQQHGNCLDRKSVV